MRVLGIYAASIFARICFRYRASRRISKGSNNFHSKTGNFCFDFEERKQVPVKNKVVTKRNKKQNGQIPLKQTVGRLGFFAGDPDRKKGGNS